METPFHSANLAIWCASSSRGVIGPYSAVTPRLSTLSDNGWCWQNFGGSSKASWTIISKHSCASGYNRAVRQPIPSKKHGIGRGTLRAARDIKVWGVPVDCQLPRLDPTALLPVNPLQAPCVPIQPNESQKSQWCSEFGLSPSVCHATAEVALRQLNCAPSKTGITSNISSARPREVIPGGASTLKQNIFDQVFMWYPIKHSIIDTDWNILIINSSAFFEKPGIRQVQVHI